MESRLDQNEGEYCFDVDGISCQNRTCGRHAHRVGRGHALGKEKTQPAISDVALRKVRLFAQVDAVAVHCAGGDGHALSTANLEALCDHGVDCTLRRAVKPEQLLFV